MWKLRTSRAQQVPCPENGSQFYCVDRHSAAEAGLCVQLCQVSFIEHRLLPMGSYPRISNAGTVMQLYGPVNSLLCGPYNRAMTAFLACVKVPCATCLHGSGVQHLSQLCCMLWKAVSKL